ncbi:MAG: winged helix-turn-helix domain-containing protein, partial [Rhodospirillaceae bacterium]|nr:winged helix-turn-helix domain-containing protein [Rhodospirillaceae bacterium]
AATADPPPGLRALSPFDPAVRDRKRLRHLFGFDFRIEIFVAEAQRQYGYYVFPLLEGDRMVGRIDMTADRAAGVLNVRRLWPEPGVRFGAGRRRALNGVLGRISRFADCREVAYAVDWLSEMQFHGSGARGTGYAR